MNSDDRFFSITCIAAALITSAVFVWSNHGVLFAGHRPSRAPQASHEARSDAPDLSGTAVEPSITPVSSESASAQESHVFTVNAEQAQVETASLVSNDSAAPISPEWFMQVVDAVLDGQAVGSSISLVPARDGVLVRTSEGGRTVVASGTHRRYAKLCTAIAHLDTAQVLQLCRNAEGPSAASNDSRSGLRSRVTRALAVLLAVEDPDFEPSMRSEGRIWQFVEPEYAALSPAQQHLLLMGRSNAKAVRAKLQTIYDELIAYEAKIAVPETSNEAIVVAANVNESDAGITAP